VLDNAIVDACAKAENPQAGTGRIYKQCVDENAVACSMPGLDGTLPEGGSDLLSPGPQRADWVQVLSASYLRDYVGLLICGIR
jgi:hypothetical protein